MDNNNVFYDRVAQSIWRPGYMSDKNKEHQRVKTEMRRSIAIDLAATFGHHDANFDSKRFMKLCGLE